MDKTLKRVDPIKKQLAKHYSGQAAGTPFTSYMTLHGDILTLNRFGANGL